MLSSLQIISRIIFLGLFILIIILAFSNESNNSNKHNKQIKSVDGSEKSSLICPPKWECRWNVADATLNRLIAAAAFCDSHVTSKLDCYWCKMLPKSTVWIGNFGVPWTTTPSKNGFGMVLYIPEKKTIYVSWRGTGTPSGWFADAEMILVQLENAPPGVKVHLGYNQNVAASIDQVASLIKIGLQKYGADTRVTMTGHSMGASLAVLAGVKINIGGYLNKKVSVDYVFGCPRVGNKKFADWVDNSVPPILPQPHFRVVWERDPMGHIPTLMQGYYHTGTEVWYMNGKFNFCDGGEDKTCSNSLDIYNVLDHAKYMGYNSLDGLSSGCCVGFCGHPH